MIEKIKEELAKGGYSADDAVALTELQSVTTTNSGALTAGGKIKLLSLAPTLINRLEAAVTEKINEAYTWNGIPTTIGAICNAGLKNLQSENVDLDMSDPQTEQMIDVIIAAGVATATDKVLIKLLSDDVNYPFSSATLREVKQARNRTNSKSTPWHGERYLIIDTLSDLPESINPIITIDNDVFSSEPIGRTVNLSGAGQYVVDLNGLGNKVVGVTALTVELWFSGVDFDLQVI